MKLVFVHISGLGERESVADQLEVTAAFLDPRYTPILTDAPLPRQGYTPPPLPSLSSILNPNAERRGEYEEGGEGVDGGGGGNDGAGEGDGSGEGREEGGRIAKNQNQEGPGVFQEPSVKHHPGGRPSHQSETRTHYRLGSGQHPSEAMLGDIPPDNYYFQSFKSVYPVYPDSSSPEFSDGPTDRFSGHQLHPPVDPSHTSTRLPNHGQTSNHYSHSDSNGASSNDPSSSHHHSGSHDYPPRYRYQSKPNYPPNQNYPYTLNSHNYPPKHHPPPSPHFNPEDILHTRPDHSYQKLPKPPGMAEVRELVTVVIDGCSTSLGLTAGVARQARGAWDGVRVVVGVDEERRAEVEDVSHLPQLSIITVS